MSLKKFLIVLLWLSSILFSIIWTYENPEKIEKIKSNFKKKQLSEVSVIEENSKNIVANSFNLEIKKILSIEGKIAFIINNADKFDAKNLELIAISATGTNTKRPFKK